LLLNAEKTLQYCYLAAFERITAIFLFSNSIILRENEFNKKKEEEQKGN